MCTTILSYVFTITSGMDFRLISKPKMASQQLLPILTLLASGYVAMLGSALMHVTHYHESHNITTTLTYIHMYVCICNIICT